MKSFVQGFSCISSIQNHCMIGMQCRSIAIVLCTLIGYSVIVSTENEFWLDCITAIEHLIVKRQFCNFTEACAMPIWYNFRICHTKNSVWFKRGVKFIGDLNNPLLLMQSSAHIYKSIQKQKPKEAYLFK